LHRSFGRSKQCLTPECGLRPLTVAGWMDLCHGSMKVTSKLNVNIGLRYDLTYVPIYGNNPNDNFYVGDMDFRNGNLYSWLTTLPRACRPMLPLHTRWNPSRKCGAYPSRRWKIFHTDYNDIQPRVGVIYQLFPNTVLRAGYGRFFDNWAAITQTAQNYEGTWPSLDQLGASNINPG